MKRSSTRNKVRAITSTAFDRKFDQGEDIFPYLDFEKAVIVKRVNIDFPVWMVRLLDLEARKMNISRQAVIKMWIAEQLARRKRVESLSSGLRQAGG